MTSRIAIVALALAALSCHERVVRPTCSADSPGMMGELNGVRYRVRLQDALSCSRETDRPVLLVFEGWASTSTRAGWDILTDESIKALIEDRLILCVLLVDDRTAINAEDYVGFPPISQDRLPKTIGNLNSLLEIKHFGKTSQPLFALVDADFRSLAEPMGYVPKKNPELLVNWIESALEQQH